jgi:uncharacterized membrane protein YbhN (UPF0104 family)
MLRLTGRVPFVSVLYSTLEKTLRGFLSFRDRKDLLVRALGLSLILQTNVVLYYYLIATGLGFSVSLGNFFFIVPLAIVIMMIPVSINAVGLRENAFVFFFSAFGVVKSEAVAFAWLDYGMILLLGMLGGIVYALRK